MGTCKFEIHYFNDNQDNRMTRTQRTSQGNDFLNLTNSRTNEKEKEIKNNFNSKIPELGKIIHIKDYEQLINDEILKYISENKLNYKPYLPKDLITYSSFPIKFKNNNVYYGNWNEYNEMEGYGVYYINEHQVVTEGVWIKGNIIFGRIFFVNGDIYEGEMKNSVPHGKGKFQFHSGEIYNGDFDMGEMTGTGVLIFSDKTIYKGEIKNGIFNGKGQMKWNYGIEYNGYFMDSCLSGKGKIFNIQGEEYDGNFEQNEFHLEGKYSFNNGDSYEGSFEYGIKKGKGIYKRNDKIIFEGIWNNDLPNGNGFIYYEGNKYKGFWRNGNLIGNIECINGNIDKISNIDLNIKPFKPNIKPNSLPHLSTTENNISQFMQNTTEFNYE